MLPSVVGLCVAFSACGGSRPVANCPDQPNLGRLSNAELDRTASGTVPDTAATTLANVRWTVAHRRGYFVRHFSEVADVRPGPGWGVTATVDQYGNGTYHRGRDYMVTVTLRHGSSCPNTTGGTVFVFGRGNSRVPVRFVYWRA